MTDLLDQAVTDAVLALLTADASLVTFDGIVPDPTPDPPYCLVYTHVMRPSGDPNNPLTGRSALWVARFIVHCVGGNAKAARAVVQRVRTNLLDVRPVVAGLACGPLRMEDTQPPQRDESTGRPVMDAVSTYRLMAI